MTSALIGHTGFVGSTLARHADFDCRFNSANIETIAGQAFDLIVCAGARAEKWRINAEPQRDVSDLQRLTAALARVRARQVVLISTVDVYPDPVGVDEDTWIDFSACAPYGRHRLALEHFVATHFETLTIRLPGLFGPGMKKNVLYDLLHNHMLDRINAESSFQFYDVTRLWRDIQHARALGLRLLNIATQPLTVDRIAREGFALQLETPQPGAPARYDMRSRHAHLFGGSNGYMQSAERVLTAIRAFAALQEPASA